MGIDIRKELAQLRAIRDNWDLLEIGRERANEYNAILSSISNKGFDVSEFLVKGSDLQSHKNITSYLNDDPPSWSEPAMPMSLFHARLDACLAYLVSEVVGDSAAAGDAMAILSSIGEHFSDYVRPLTNRRRSGKKPFEIADEYDVQDLIEAALRLHFEDVELEEATPSYASKFSKMDFFLPEEGIAIEVKYVRDKGHAKEIGTEINDDVPRYDERPDCAGLIAYIYDPNHYIVNSPGLKKDLERHQIKGKPICVYICN